MISSPFSFILSAALALFGGLVHAEKADRNKPMNIEADALRFDDLKQTSIFTGRVVLTKGTIMIRGAVISVRQDPEGYQYGLVTAEPGKLAFFRQKRDSLDEFIEGEGATIEYDGRADTVKFITTAQLRRYRGATLSDEFTGAIILYNNSTDVFTVDGVVSRTQGGESGRVRAMLTPAPDAAVSTSAKENLLPPPMLRTSPTLDGDKK